MCLRDNCFFLGCSSDSSDTEKPDVENKTEVQDESIDDSESILSLFDNTSSFETAGSNDQDNEFFSNNNSTVSKSIGEFPNRASLIEWHKILKAKDKHEIITNLGMPDRTYNSGTVFCYYNKLRNETGNDLHLAFHAETLLIDKIGWNAPSLKPIEAYSGPLLMVPGGGVEPPLPKEPDFESGASTNSAIQAYQWQSNIWLDYLRNKSEFYV